MAHFIFLVLHIVAVVFVWPGLIVTIPAHLIYAAVSGQGPDQRDQPKPDTHVRCPDCRELVRKDAVVCKHCGCKLIPDLS